MKEYRSERYQYLVLAGKLTAHLNQVDREVREQVAVLVEQTATQQGVTEKMKEEDAIMWVKKMNEIRSIAEKMTLENKVYM